MRRAFCAAAALATALALTTAPALTTARAETVFPGDSGGGATPGGSSGQLQFNNAGVLGGGAGTAWDDTSRTLTITNSGATQSTQVNTSEVKFNRAGTTYVYNANASGSIKIGVGAGPDGMTVNADKSFTFSDGAISPRLVPVTIEHKGFSIARDGTAAVGEINVSQVWFGSNVSGSTLNARVSSLGANFNKDSILTWGSAANSYASQDISLQRDAAGVFGVRGASATTAAAVSLYTYGASPPAAPGASIARIYADTSGGKIRLMALFPSGAAQQIAIEP